MQGNLAEIQKLSDLVAGSLDRSVVTMFLARDLRPPLASNMLGF